METWREELESVSMFEAGNVNIRPPSGCREDNVCAGDLFCLVSMAMCNICSAYVY